MAPWIATSTLGQVSPNETTGHAVIGTGSQGGGHCRRFAQAKGCGLVAVCDVDSARLAQKVKGLPDEEQIRIQAPEPVESIVENFLTAVRENDPARLNSPIDHCAVGVNLCHLANIGTRLGAPALEYEPAKEQVRCHELDAKAAVLLGREYRRGYELPYRD